MTALPGATVVRVTGNRFTAQVALLNGHAPIKLLAKRTGSRIVIDSIALQGIEYVEPPGPLDGDATPTAAFLTILDSDLPGATLYGVFAAGIALAPMQFAGGLFLSSQSDLWVQAAPIVTPALGTIDYTVVTIEGRFEAMPLGLKEQVFISSGLHGTAMGYIADDVFTAVAQIDLTNPFPIDVPAGAIPIILPFGAPSLPGLVSRLEALTSIFVENQFSVGFEGTFSAASGFDVAWPIIVGTRGPLSLPTLTFYVGAGSFGAEFGGLTVTNDGIILPPGDGLSVDLGSQDTSSITAGQLWYTLTGRFTPNAPQGPTDVTIIP
jgi:hypothetical protein